MKIHGLLIFRLRKSNVEVKFVTNTTKECRRILFERLVRLGFELNIDEIFSSLSAARKFILQNNLHPLLLVDKEALEDFSDIDLGGKIDSIVIGLAPEYFNYNTLNKAFRYISQFLQFNRIFN